MPFAAKAGAIKPDRLSVRVSKPAPPLGSSQYLKPGWPAVQIGLVYFFMILSIEVVGDVRDFHPQVSWKFKNADFWCDKIHT
jgi:hypothetical protein